MELMPTDGKWLHRIRFGEVFLIAFIGICFGVVFNLFWVNRVPFLTPSKAELYALKNIPSLTLDETKRLYDKGESLFLDARGAMDYEHKHIKGALNLPVNHFDLYYPKLKSKLPKDADIVVYCEGEECGASLHLSEELVRMQYTDIKVFLGGWIEWNKAGYPSQ
jgi:rhodanese-related sulfurtransferase